MLLSFTRSSPDFYSVKSGPRRTLRDVPHKIVDVRREHARCCVVQHLDGPAVQMSFGARHERRTIPRSAPVSMACNGSVM